MFEVNKQLIFAQILYDFFLDTMLMFVHLRSKRENGGGGRSCGGEEKERGGGCGEIERSTVLIQLNT